eukprot:678780-Pyramimonas_sp.AAC.1
MQGCGCWRSYCSRDPSTAGLIHVSRSCCAAKVLGCGKEGTRAVAVLYVDSAALKFRKREQEAAETCGPRYAACYPSSLFVCKGGK